MLMVNIVKAYKEMLINQKRDIVANKTDPRVAIEITLLITAEL